MSRQQNKPQEGAAKPSPGQQRRPVFLINLRQDTERLKFMKKQLDAMGLEFEVVEAVNGYSIPETERQKMIAADTLHPILPGELGCYLSHMKAHQIMVDRNIPEALFLQDDVLLSKDFAAVFNGCELPEECQILQLAGTGRHLLRNLHKNCSSFALPLPRGYRMSPRIGILWGLHAYILRLHYAQRLVQNALPMKIRTDNLMMDWKYCLYLPWVAYKKDADSRYRLLGREAPIAGKRPNNRDRREDLLLKDLQENLREGRKKLPAQKKDAPMPVFVIHIARDVQHPAAVVQQLKRWKIPFETIIAEDGEQKPETLSAAETARHRAHIKAHQTALQTGAPAAMILEGDISLGEDFPAWFQGGPERYRMPRMVWPKRRERYVSPYRVKPLMLECKPVPRVPGLWDKTFLRQYARAYIIRRSQMRRLLQKQEKRAVDAPIEALLFSKTPFIMPEQAPRRGLILLWMSWIRFSTLRWPWMLHHKEKVQMHTSASRSALLGYVKFFLSLYSPPRPFGIKRLPKTKCQSASP